MTFLVTGGTGSGKTTLLSSLLARSPRASASSSSRTPASFGRPPARRAARGAHANVEGAGAVDLRELVRQALRMRPDRLVVGEVRGAEVVDLLAALNTGHDGGCGTVHANSAEALPARLEALALAAGLGRDALHSQLVAAVQLVVHLVRTRRRPPRRGSAAWTATATGWPGGRRAARRGRGRLCREAAGR